MIKKINFVLPIVLISICSSYAQSQSSTPEERAQKWDEWMKKELTITPDQEATVHAINLKYAQLNEQVKGTSDAKRTKFQEVRSNEDNKEKELKDVLTKEQFKLYQEKKKDMQKKMLQSMRN